MNTEDKKENSPASPGAPAAAGSTDKVSTDTVSSNAPTIASVPPPAAKDLAPQPPAAPEVKADVTEGERLAAENKEFGTSDMPLVDRNEAWQSEFIETEKENIRLKAENERLKNDLEIFARSVPENARTLGEGTQLILGDVVVTLAYPAAVVYEGYESEQKFVGMLLGSIAPEKNFDANMRSLKLIYNRSTGGSVAMEDQSDQALGHLLEDSAETGNFRRILAVTHEDIEAEITKRRTPAATE